MLGGTLGRRATGQARLLYRVNMFGGNAVIGGKDTGNAGNRRIRGRLGPGSLGPLFASMPDLPRSVPGIRECRCPQREEFPRLTIRAIATTKTRRKGVIKNRISCSPNYSGRRRGDSDLRLPDPRNRPKDPLTKLGITVSRKLLWRQLFPLLPLLVRASDRVPSSDNTLNRPMNNTSLSNYHLLITKHTQSPTAFHYTQHSTLTIP